MNSPRQVSQITQPATEHQRLSNNLTILVRGDGILNGTATFSHSLAARVTSWAAAEWLARTNYFGGGLNGAGAGDEIPASSVGSGAGGICV